jgi:hypothetical protein
MGEAFSVVWGDAGAFSSDEETFEDPFPALIAAKTSPFSSVPWELDAFNVDESNPYSVISNFADGLILATLVFWALASFPSSWCVVISSLIPKPLLALFFTVSISAGSSTLKTTGEVFSYGASG